MDTCNKKQTIKNNIQRSHLKTYIPQFHLYEALENINLIYNERKQIINYLGLGQRRNWLGTEDFLGKIKIFQILIGGFMDIYIIKLKL